MSDQIKIPVTGVFKEAFRFSLRRFPTVLRLCAASLLIVAVPISALLYLLVPRLLSRLDAVSSYTGAEIIPVLMPEPLFWITLLVLLASSLSFVGMVLVPLTRLIVLDERPPALSFNPTFGTFLKAWAALTGLTAALFLGVLATLLIPEALYPGLISMAAAREGGEDGWSMVLTSLPLITPALFLIFALYALIRLEWFLIDAVVHDSINLRRSWRLTRHNVWRLIALSIVVALAGSAVMNIIQAFALPLASLTEDLPLTGPTSTSLIDALGLAFERVASSPVALGGITLAAILYCWLIGFTYAVPAYGYKALTNDPGTQ